MDKLSKVTPRNNLVIMSEYSKLVAMLSEKVRDEFKNLDLQDVKKDVINLILFICDLAECAHQEQVVNKKVLKKLNKNELVIDVVKCLFPSLSDVEIIQFQNMLQFAIDSKLIKKKGCMAKVLDSCGKVYKYFKR